MKVIVVATGSEILGGGERGLEPAELRWTLDRPFIQHVVEALVDGGAEEIHFVLARRPELFEELLGDGRRWGSRFSYHLAKDGTRPYGILRTIPIGGLETVLLVHGDQLVASPLWRDGDAAASQAFVWKPEGDGRTLWTGWAWVRMDRLLAASHGEDRTGLWGRLGHELVMLAVPEPLQTRESRDFHRSVRRILDGEHEGLLLFGHQARVGVWLERNVSLDSTAEIVPPVYLGENSHIGAGARIGPGAAIGADSYVDQQATIADAVILPGTYVGQGVEVERSIVDRESLVNLDLGAAVSVPDEMLLGSLEGPTIAPALSRLFFRGVAFVMLVVTTPILAVLRAGARFGYGSGARSRAVLGLPAPLDPHRWETAWVSEFAQDDATGETPGFGHFLHSVVPGLPAVVRGHVDLIGLPMRRPDEVLLLDREWRAMYLGGRAGLISERLVEFGDGARLDEAFAAEAIYMSRRGFLHDLRLLGRYAGQVAGLATRARAVDPVTVAAPESLRQPVGN